MNRLSDLSQDAVMRMAEESPSRLVVMVYDVAIDGLRTAARAADHGDVVARFEATVRTADAIEQLQGALDVDNGGEVARNLDGLYAFVVGQLPMVNLHNDAALARRLAAVLEPLRRSWAELDEGIRNGTISLDDNRDLPSAADTRYPLVAAAG